MKHGDIIKELLKINNKTQQELAELMNTTQSTIGSSLTRNIRISSFVNILNALGYSVVIQPTKKKLTKDQWELTNEDTNDRGNVA